MSFSKPGQRRYTPMMSTGLLWFFLAMPAHATTTLIDLNYFFASSTVIITTDGSSALLMEDPFANPVVLVNDPYLGDLNVILPDTGLKLAFEYVFEEAIGNNDEFTVILFDATASGGPVFGVLDLVIIDSSHSGTVQFNLTPYAGFTLGLYFELFDLSLNGLESSVEISNLRLVDAIVPLPAGIWLLLSGIGVLLIKVNGGRTAIVSYT